VSLRTDIHSAFDQVAPSTLGMPERVFDSVQVSPPRRGAPGLLVMPFRSLASLVAVFLMVGVVAGVLLGGRLTQDWKSFTHPSAAAGGVTKAIVTQLEARPDQLPILSASASCPDGPESWGDYGIGPVMGAYGWPQPETATERAGFFTNSWGTYFYDTFVTVAGLNGPILVRGRDLRTNQALIFVGANAAGPLVGTDKVDGKSVQQHVYLVLDMNHPPSPAGAAKHLEWPVIVGISKQSSDCVGFQLDGPGFTETFVVDLVGKA
jgi:hypothetical protein